VDTSVDVGHGGRDVVGSGGHVVSRDNVVSGGDDVVVTRVDDSGVVDLLVVFRVVGDALGDGLIVNDFLLSFDGDVFDDFFLSFNGDVFDDFFDSFDRDVFDLGFISLLRDVVDLGFPSGLGNIFDNGFVSDFGDIFDFVFDCVVVGDLLFNGDVFDLGLFDVFDDGLFIRDLFDVRFSLVGLSKVGI